MHYSRIKMLIKEINPFMRLKMAKHTLKRFLKYVWSFYNIKHERVKAAPYFIHYSCMVIILFAIDLCMSAFTYSFKQLVFRLPVFFLF